MKKITLLLTAMLISFSVFSQWTPLTSGTTQSLLGASFINDNTGWVVGAAGTIIKTTDGTTFTAQSSTTVNDLYSTLFINADTGYAVGNNGTILKTINGGTSWATITSPVVTQLRDVYFTTASIGFITGGLDGSIGYILKTTDGGTTWTSIPTGLSYCIYGIYFTDAMTGYACDANGDIIKTIDGGSTWTPLTSGTGNHLFGIYFTDSSTGYIVGDPGVILKTSNGGSTWTPETSGTTDYLYYVKFITATTGYAIGGNVGANTSTILKTTDAGLTWTVETTSSTRQYVGSFPGHSGYSFGINGTILKITGLSSMGINEYTNNNIISIYPNPANNIVNINYQLPNNATEAIVNTYNYTGKLINSQLLQGNKGLTTLNVENLSNGLYLYNIIVGGTITATQRIVISK